MRLISKTIKNNEKKRLNFKSVLAVSAFFLSINNFAQVTMLGTPSLDYSNVPHADGVSDDGKVVGLSSSYNTFYWTPTEGIVKIGQFVADNTFTAGAVNITRDGKKAILYSGNTADNVNQFSIYDLQTKQWTFLASTSTNFKTDDTTPYGMTPDGSTIVGLALAADYSFAKAIKWNAGVGLQDLGSINPARYYSALDINDDGSVIVGYQDQDNGFRQASIWKNGVQELLTNANGDPLEVLTVISGDGNSLLGYQGHDAVKWTKDKGIVIIPDANAGENWEGAATASNYDGSIIVGYYKTPNYAPPGDGKGFIWTAQFGKQDLNDFVKNLGFDDHGIRLAIPQAISANGKQIVGIGQTSEGDVSFLITLPDNLAVTDAKISNFEIYPNPVGNELNINAKGSLENVSIFDISGKQVLNQQDFKNNKTINVSNLPKGTYVLKATINSKEQTKKFIKK